MSSSSATIYLVTGTNKGIGLEYVTQISKLPNTFVYAACRNPLAAEELNALAKERGNIKVVQISDDVEPDTTAVAALIQKEHGRLDVVIANAGNAYGAAPVRDLSIELFKKSNDVNLYYPLILFQKTRSLLAAAKSSTRSPKFVYISTFAGSIGFQENMSAGIADYSASKAAANLIVRRIGLEEKEAGILALILHPGVVTTATALPIIEAQGLQPLAITPTESVESMLNVINGYTTESPILFYDYKGEVIPW